MSAEGPPFTPLAHAGGYPLLEDLGVIGDGRTAALVARDGSIPWLCLPHFDSPAVFCGLLDRRRGGAFVLALEGAVEARQYYEDETAVLVTELRGPDGTVRITDALLLTAQADLSEDAPAGRNELLRSVQVLDGDVRVRVAVLPRGGADAEPRGGGLRIRLRARDDLELQLCPSRPLQALDDVVALRAGERLDLVLGWGELRFRSRGRKPDELLGTVRTAWRSWSERVQAGDIEPARVLRSAITLKLLDFFENGAMVAAVTSSLPEEIGGERNWDYRFTWIRDAAFSVYALLRVGLAREAAGFLAWVLDAVVSIGRPCVLYQLDGRAAPPERTDDELEG
jgi:GH15 family glucan-1,4-alpha-glucosidase